MDERLAAETAEPDQREAERNRRLHSKWRNMKERSEEFRKFPGFKEWAIRTGYEIGDSLRRIDETKPFGPDNCVWVKRRTNIKEEPKALHAPGVVLRALEWNRAVNPLRRAAGLEPFPETEDEADVLH